MARKSLKGFQFERDFAKRLSLCWSRGAADDWFWRVGGSGGRATGRAKQGLTTAGGAGDIVATCPEGAPLTNLVTFELKRGYNKIRIEDLFFKPNSELTQFLIKLRGAAEHAGTPYWCLVLKQDRKPELVFHNMGPLMGHISENYMEIYPDCLEYVWLCCCSIETFFEGLDKTTPNRLSLGAGT